MAVLDFQFHPKQLEFYKAIESKRNIIVNAGRRSGKTYFATRLAIIYLLQGKAIGYFTPQYTHLTDVWNVIERELRKYGVIEQCNTTLKIIKTINGGSIRFYSTDANADVGRGFSFDLAIIDEAGLIPSLEAIYDNAIRPTLLQTKGKTLIISTPKSSGGSFFKMFAKWQAKSKADDSYAAFCGSTYDNPFIPVKEIDEYKQSVASWVFDQEVNAIPAADSGMTFPGLEEILIDEPTANDTFVTCLSMDLARSPDFCVVLGENQYREVIYIKRFQGKDWNDVYSKILDGLLRNITVVADKTGVGAPICDRLEYEGYRLEPFVFSNTNKNLMVEQLRFDISQRNIKLWKPIADVIIQECNTYEYHTLDSGKMAYGGAMGCHDDTVAALLLLNWYRHINQMSLAGGIRNIKDLIVNRIESTRVNPFIRPKCVF